MKLTDLCAGVLLSGVVVLPLAGSAMEITENTVLNDDTDWRGQGEVTIAEGVTLDVAGHNLYVDDIGGSGTITSTGGVSFKMFRFYVDETRGSFHQISEIKLYGGDGNVVTGEFTVSSDTETKTADGRISPDGERPEKAFDGNLGTKWLDFRSDPNEELEVRAAVWVQIEYAEAKNVTRYEWYTGNDTKDNVGRNPKSWRLLGSNDGETWTVLDAQVGLENLTTANSTLAFTGYPLCGQLGALHVDVPANTVAENGTVTLAGRLALVKEGPGVFEVKKRGQTYVDGSYVLAGTLQLPQSVPGGVDYGHYSFKNPFGENGQKIVVGPGGTFDTTGNYDQLDFNIILDGGTLANSVADMTHPEYGGSAPDTLTRDSSAVFMYDFVWNSHQPMEMNGHTLTVSLADGKMFHLSSVGEFKDGAVVVNPTSVGGCFYVHYGSNSSTCDFDFGCGLVLDYDFTVKSATIRQNAAFGLGSAAAKMIVLDKFTPIGDYFPNVELVDGATLDLSSRTTPLPIKSGDGLQGVPFMLAFADDSTITIDIHGRTPEIGEQLVAWDAYPANITSLSFVFDEATGNEVVPSVTSHGIFYGSGLSADTVVSATWTGDAGDGDITNFENWHCTNSDGDVLPDACPGADATVVLSGSLFIDIGADSSFNVPCVILEDIELVGDSDLSGLVNVAITSSATIDLQGHDLMITGFAGIAEVTDSVGGGELHIVVPAGAELRNESVTISGGLTLVKEGAGTFVAARGKQSYAGGTRIAEGVVKPGVVESVLPFGSRLSRITVEDGAIFDANGKLAGYIYEVVNNDGGTMRLGETGSVGVPDFADFQYNGDASFIDSEANEIQLTKNVGNSRGTVFWKQRVNPAMPWRATFKYLTVEPNDPADGFAFILQNSSRGLEAMGGTGGSLAVDNVSPSFGCAYNVFSDDSVGFINDGAKVNLQKNISGIDLVKGVDVVVTYDGKGTFTQKITQDDGNGVKTAVFLASVDLEAKLGTTAWVGFTAACGGSFCDQRIRDFTFSTYSETVEIVLDPTSDGWSYNVNATYVAAGESTPAKIQVTPAENNQRGSATFSQRIDISNSFRLSGTFEASEGSGMPADGVGMVFHDGGATSCGGGGGSRGFSGEGFNNVPSVGWAFNIYQSSRLDYVLNGGASSVINNPDGFAFANGGPVDFVITYTNQTFTIDLNQGGATCSASKSVDLAESIGRSSAYFSLTGATGGENARQCFYNLDFEYLSLSSDIVPRGGGHGLVVVSGETELEVLAGSNGAGVTTLAALSFASGSNLGVSTTAPEDTDYTVCVETIRQDAGSVGTDSPTLVLNANGTGSGTLRIGAVEPSDTGRMLKIVGNVARLGGDPIRVIVPTIPKWMMLPILDLRDAPGLTVDDFVLVTDMDEPNRISLAGGVLTVRHGDGFILLVR